MDKAIYIQGGRKIACPFKPVKGGNTIDIVNDAGELLVSGVPLKTADTAGEGEAYIVKEAELVKESAKKEEAKP